MSTARAGWTTRPSSRSSSATPPAFSSPVSATTRSSPAGPSTWRPCASTCSSARGGDAHIPFTVLKLPSSDNIADNFWRPGNLVCALDPDTGTIRTARTKDAFGTTGHASHPATGAPLVGETLPLWDRVLDLARTCAPVFAPIRYQSMDIAITPAGPMLVEIDTGGSFTLPQYASGRGFLTDEVRAFFRACGHAKV